MAREERSVCCALILLLVAVAHQAQVAVAQAVDTCQYSMLLFKPASRSGDEAEQVAVNKLTTDMKNLCKEFEKGGPYDGKALMCTERSGPASVMPWIMIQVNGCCTGEISKALQVVYPSILECRAIGIGLKPLALDVTVQPGERKPPPPSPPPPSPPPPVSSGTGSNGTILDGGTVGANLTNASGSSDKGFAAALEDILGDWWFWVIISLITAAMLMLCIVCTICLCRQQKKRERDIKYQADRQVRLAMSQVSKKSNEEALLDGSSLNSDVESPAPRKPASKSQSSRVIETQPLVVVDGDEELNEHKELVITSPTRMNSEIEFSDSDDGEQLDRFNSETRKMGKAAAGLSAGDSFDDGSFVSGSSSSPGGSGNGLTGVAPDASNGAATQLRGTGRADIVEVPASQFTHKNGTAARPSRPFHVSSSGHEDDLSDMDIQERSSK